MVASLMAGSSTGWAQPDSSATRFARAAGGGKLCGPSIVERVGSRAGASASIAFSLGPMPGTRPSRGAKGLAGSAASIAKRKRPG